MKVLFYDLVKAVSVSSSSASVTLLYVGCLLFISSYTHKCLSLSVSSASHFAIVDNISIGNIMHLDGQYCKKNCILMFESAVYLAYTPTPLCINDFNHSCCSHNWSQCHFQQ